MKKLDWYILKKFLRVFFFSIFLFAVIAVVIDVSEKTDDFVRSGLSGPEIFTHYYIGFIPHIIALLFPLFVFIAVIFFTSKMAGQTEIVAILASGTTYNRWLRPYWIGGVLLGLLLWVSNQWIVPKANNIRGSFEAAYVDAHSSYNALITCSPQAGDYSVEMFDSYGDGWQTDSGSGGSGIAVDIDGTIVEVGLCSPYGGAAGTFLESGAGTGCTENNGYEGTGTVNIPVGTSSATWSFPGDAYGEISFSVFGPGGEELYVGAQGATGPGLLPITLCAQ